MRPVAGLVAVDAGAQLRALAESPAVSSLHAACARAAAERRLFGRARAPLELAGRRFEVLRSLGGGGMGVVYEVASESGAPLALKLLRGADAERLFALKHEFRALAGLEHPGLVAYEDLLVDGELAAITMELVDGVDFVRYATRAGGARLVDATARLAEALCALHDAGRVHRDVKPTNVLVDGTGRVVLLDFGIAGESGVAGDASGTAGFLAPECWRGARLSPAADCFAVGVLVGRALDALPADHRDPRLLALTASLCAEDPARRPDARALLHALGCDAPLAPKGREVIARTDALAQLTAWARAGETRLAIVEAPSGFGKSTLLDQLGRALAEVDAVDRVADVGDGRVADPDGVWLLRGRCERRERVPNRTLDALLDALSVRLRALDAGTLEALLPDDVGALARLFPVLARVPAIGAHGARAVRSEPLHERRRAIVALRELLARLAATRRLVLVIDDAQWADDDGVRLVEELLRAPGAPPVMIVLALRPDGQRRLPLDALVRRADGRITLGAVAQEDAERILRGRLPHAAPARLAAIAGAAHGDPLLLHELGAAAIRSSAGPCAPTVEALVAERLSGLGPHERAAAELLCLTTRPLGAARVAAVLGLDERDATRALRGLRAARLARVSDGAQVATELSHDRFAEVLRQGLDEPRRCALHARIATVLEREPGAEPDVLVHHWVHAAEPQRACARAIDAAREARSRLAFDREARFYELALELAQNRPDAPSLQAALADALARASRGQEAARHYAALAEREPDREIALKHRRRAAEELLFAGRREEGLATLDAVLASVGLRRAPSRTRAIASIVGRRLWLSLRGRRYRLRASADVPPRLLHALDASIAAMRTLAGMDVVAGYQWTTRALSLALRAGEPGRLARTLAVEATYRALAGHADSEALAVDAQRLAEIAGDPSVLASVHQTLALRAYGVGDPLTGRTHAERVLSLAATHEIESGITAWSARHLLTTLRAGDEPGLRAALEDGIRSAAERGDRLPEIAYRHALVFDRITHGELAEARAELADLRRRAGESASLDGQAWTGMMCEVQIELAEGAAAAAWARLRAAWPQLQRTSLLRLPLYRAVSWHTRGTAALAVSPDGESGRDARRCRDRLLADRNPHARDLGVQLAVLLEARSGDPAPACTQLLALADRFEARGWIWHAEACRVRAAELDADPATLASLRLRLSGRGIADPALLAALHAAPVRPAETVRA